MLGGEDYPALTDAQIEEFFSQICDVCGHKRGECTGDILDAGNFPIYRFGTPYGPSHSVPLGMPIKTTFSVIIPKDWTRRIRYIEKAEPIS
jgi:hypothetical protein